ncbi:MAG TPA: AMP-binding protein, partial [Quisquiliibacterium sp.]|nr:AMP-binding protein [Quisquiliibacterium sp.]
MSARDPMYDECSMGDLVVRAIQRGGDRVAFVLDDQAYTYRAYGDLLGRFVQALKARGLKRGDAIAVLSSNRPEAFLPTAAAYLMGLRITWMHPLGSEDDH